MKKVFILIALTMLSSRILLFSATEYEKRPGSGGEFISCPLESATATITNPLPDGWWTTPQVGKLQDVRVDTVGGHRVLMCGYWAYSTTAYIMREFPDGAKDCRVENNGFRCE